MKKVLGLDLGSRTCGIAISDVLGIAHGRENYRFTDGAYRQVLAYILEYLKKENVGVVALGYPLNMDGSKSESALRSERFKETINVTRRQKHEHKIDDDRCVGNRLRGF